MWFAEAAAVGIVVDLDLAAAGRALALLDRMAVDAYLSVNLFPETVSSPHLADALAGVALDRLVIEVTEHAPVEDYEMLNGAITDLRAKGCRLAIDDTGAGFASLRHILRLAPDIIKLDMTLTRGIDADRALRALDTALISFARDIGATIVAEGVETQAELDALRALGVTYAQGYFFARPGPMEQRGVACRAGAPERARPGTDPGRATPSEELISLGEAFFETRSGIARREVRFLLKERPPRDDVNAAGMSGLRRKGQTRGNPAAQSHGALRVRRATEPKRKSS